MPTQCRRRFIAGLGSAALLAVVGNLASPAAARAAGSSSLPIVDMEAVLKAAQWDPQKIGSGITLGSGPSVLLVERALQAEGLLKASLVDGHYGTSTVAAYVGWQHRLGYSGLGANGLPGEASLTRLAAGRFTVTSVVRPGGRVAFGGHLTDARAAAMLREVQSVTGLTMRVDQGSYSTSDPSSADTHAGGGAVDIGVDGWSAARRRTVTAALRRVGFAAWLRSPTEGPWPWHIHAVAISDPDLSPPAQAQVGHYFRGRNGLRDDGPDTGPIVEKVSWEEYLRRR